MVLHKCSLIARPGMIRMRNTRFLSFNRSRAFLKCAEIEAFCGSQIKLLNQHRLGLLMISPEQMLAKMGEKLPMSN